MTTYPTMVLALLAMAGAMPVWPQGSGAGAGSGQGRARSAAMSMKEVSYLGIGVEDVNPERARALKLKEERGAFITSVMPDTPASKAGLKESDVVLEYNGRRVEGKEELIQMVRDTPAGKSVKIFVWRNGALLNLWATVESHKVMESEDGAWSVNLPNLPTLPTVSIPPIDIPRMITIMQNSTLGIEGEGLAQQPQFAEFFGVKEGVLIKSVVKGSAAERAGMKAGDVLVKIGDNKVAAWRDLATALRYAQPGRTVAVVVVRNKRETPLSVTIEEGR